LTTPFRGYVRFLLIAALCIIAGRVPNITIFIGSRKANVAT
jgi:hypothetical protein